jgi:CBS-domain-containing membrane protein
MRRDWLQTARDAIRRDEHRNAVAGAVAGLGAAIAIGVMEWFSLASHYPLFIIPFATSVVLVIGSPEAEPAQPRALIGGHVVATLLGLAVLELTGRRPGQCRRGGARRPGNACHRNVSSACGDQSPAGGLK